MRSLANRWFSGGITGCSNAKLSITGAYQEILMKTGSRFLQSYLFSVRTFDL